MRNSGQFAFAVFGHYIVSKTVIRRRCNNAMRFLKQGESVIYTVEPGLGYYTDWTWGVFLVKTKNAFVPVERDNSVNTYSRISTVPRGSERSE